MERERSGRVKRVRASTRETQAACSRPKRRTRPSAEPQRSMPGLQQLADQEGSSEALEGSDQIAPSQLLPSQSLPSQPPLISEAEALPGSRAPHQSHATRIRNQQENYKQIREKQLAKTQLLSHKEVLESKHRHSKRSMEQLILEETCKASCNICGLTAQSCGEPAKHIAVTLISLLHVSKIEVPVFQRSRYHLVL